MTMERWRPGRGMTLWRPFRELDELQRRFEDFMPFWPALRRLPFDEREWVPAIDMYEKDNKYIVKTELPGMKEEDIDVSVSAGRLTIKGEKKSESEIKEEDYYRSERSYGRFFRSIDLPSDADSDKIEASFENGILEVAIAKTETARPKKVLVSPAKKSKAKAAK
jgi:HSP20 family protein